MKNLNAMDTRTFSNSKTSLIAFIIFLLCCLASFNMQAQNKSAQQIVEQYLNKHSKSLGLAKADVTEFQISDHYTDDHNGLTHIYVQQQYEGIDIIGANLGLHFQNENEMVFVSNRFFKKINQRLGNSSQQINALAAVETAAADLGLSIQEPIKALESAKGVDYRQTFAKGNIAMEDIPVKLVYYPLDNGTLNLSWEVQIYTTDAQHYWITVRGCSRRQSTWKTRYGHQLHL